MVLDLADFDYNKLEAILEVKDPNGEPTDMRIRVLSTESSASKKSSRELAAKYLPILEKMKVKHTTEAGKDSGSTVEFTAKNATEISNLEADIGVRILVAVTLGWEGFVMDGEEIPCTIEKVTEIYKDFDWIRTQVDTFVADQTNFSRSSAKDSKNTLDSSSNSINKKKMVASTVI